MRKRINKFNNTDTDFIVVAMLFLVMVIFLAFLDGVVNNNNYGENSIKTEVIKNKSKNP